MLVWTILALSVVIPRDTSGVIIMLHILVLLATIGFTVLLFIGARTHEEKHRHRIKPKRSYIVGEIDPTLFDPPDTSGDAPGP